MQSMLVLVTGADGFLGSHVVSILLNAGYRVRALVQPGRQVAALENLPVEQIPGDLLDVARLQQAVADADYVIHIAALTHMFPDKHPLVRKVNIDGTLCLLEAVKNTRVKRFVFVGSANSFGPARPKAPSDETTPYAGARFRNDYIQSKYEALQHVLKAGEEGLDVVSVHPTFMLGPGDSLPGSGAMVIAVYKRKLPGYSPGGKNYICVKDAARGVVNALTMGQAGECYILGNENLDYKQAFEKIAAVVGVKPPAVGIPRMVLLLYGYLGNLYALFTGKKPMVSHTMARISCDDYYYVSDKAVRELNLPQTPIETGIREAYEWFGANGYLHKK